MTDQRLALFVALAALCPWMLVAIVALVRGYDIHVTVTRRLARRRRRRDEGTMRLDAVTILLVAILLVALLILFGVGVDAR